LLPSQSIAFVQRFASSVEFFLMVNCTRDNPSLLKAVPEIVPSDVFLGVVIVLIVPVAKRGTTTGGGVGVGCGVGK